MNKLARDFFLMKIIYAIAVFICLCGGYLYYQTQKTEDQHRYCLYHISTNYWNLNQSKLTLCRYVAEKYFPKFEFFENPIRDSNQSDLIPGALYLRTNQHASDREIIIYLSICSIITNLPFEWDKNENFDNLITWLYEYLSCSDICEQAYTVYKNEDTGDLMYCYFPIKSTDGNIQPLIQYEPNAYPDLYAEPVDCVGLLNVNSINGAGNQFWFVILSRNMFWKEVDECLKKISYENIERDINYLNEVKREGVSVEAGLIKGAWKTSGKKYDIWQRKSPNIKNWYRIK